MSEKVDVHFTYNADYIMLAYRRHPRLRGDEHVHAGYFDTQVDGHSELVEFGEMTYAEMFRNLSELANRFPTARLVLRRLEQGPDSTALALGEDSCELIRKDPGEYVKKTTLPPQRIVLKLGADARVTDAVKVDTIRSGHDTLADAFGDLVYIRAKDGKYESPITGRWELPGDIGVWTLAAIGKWASVPTAELLNQEKDRYFLPRKWNENGPWISHEELKAKYEKYLEEKESCRRTHSDDPPAS